MMPIIVGIVALFIGLMIATFTGCENEEERAARHDQMCKSYGAKEGTPEYIQCRATIHLTEYNKEQLDAQNAMAMSVVLSASSSVGK